MKKLTVILCAGLVALAAVSCKKGEEPVVAPMTPDQTEQKLVQVAVNAINEVDPDNWGGWLKTCYGLESTLANLAGDDGLEDLADDLRTLFVTEEKVGNVDVIKAIIRLSQIKGNLTIENNILKYTKGDNSLNLVMTYEGKTYKAWIESTGESATPIEVFSREFETEKNIVSVYVPQTAAVHVTENNSLFLDLVVNPVVSDNNQNGKLDDGDAVSGSLTFQIPNYALAINNMSVSETAVSGVISFTHGSTTILSLDGKVEFEYHGLKSLIPPGFEMDDIDINSLSVMNGQAILKGSVDWEDIDAILSNESYASQSDAETASRALNNSVKAQLFFDNNYSICQAWFTTKVKAANQGGDYYVVPAIAYADGTVKTFDEYSFQDEVWDPVKVAATNFADKVNKLLPKNNDNQVQ